MEMCVHKKGTVLRSRGLQKLRCALLIQNAVSVRDLVEQILKKEPEAQSSSRGEPASRSKFLSYFLISLSRFDTGRGRLGQSRVSENASNSMSSVGGF